jgi:hypothetical protein
MSFMTIQPDVLAAAASDLSLIGSAISADNAAAGPITAVVPAAADEVSAPTAAQFAARGHVSGGERAGGGGSQHVGEHPER